MRRRLLPTLLLTALLFVSGGSANAQNALDQLTIQDGVCQIGTPQDLANFALAVNDGNASLDAVVTQDLDFATFEGEFSGIAKDGLPYLGTFDGQGHRIKNLTIDGKHEYFAGLFRMVGDGCVIKNLVMDKTCAIINGSNACAMVASNYNKANCTITLIGLGNEGKVESSGQYVGAIAAINYSYTANYIIQDCWSTGEVIGSVDVAQLCGHLYHGTISNCWSTSKVTCNNSSTKLFDNVNDAKINNCYTLGGSDVKTFTEEELASGALCYKLNGDQTEIHWTQTIGTDPYPQYGTGSKQVYAIGTLRCDGAEIPGSPITYSNTEGQPTKPDHQYGADGVCTVCGSMQQNEAGYYLIGTADQLHWVAQRIEQGEIEMKVLLTADIDLSKSNYPNLMIGNTDARFAGIFDGGGHTITYNYDFSANYCGLFSYISSATIRNLRVEGEVVTRGIHYGALIGYGAGTMLIENVVTNVNITGEHSGVTGNGGMIGALYGDITFNNCATLGIMGYPGSSMYCGFVAFASGEASSTLNNCFTACQLTEGTGTDYCFTFCRGKAAINNCYYLNPIGEQDGGTQITEEQLQNGSVCYKLNGDQSNIQWTQTIGTDLLPQSGTGSKRVYASGTVRCDGAEYPDKPLTYSNTESYPTKPDHKYDMSGICTVCGGADPNAVKQNEQGYYLIGNPSQLQWLYLKIEDGEGDAKVLLTDDIDLTGSDYPDLMIGTEGKPFRGIFDGNGHTITYNYENVSSKWRGLFAFVNGATIRNLRVEGSAYVKQIHYGALIGRADGTVLVENVITNVNITGAMNQVTGDAGMVGANYAQMTFNNCATLGEMGYAEDGKVSSMYSSFSGWSDGGSSTTLNNCYTACRLTEGTGTGNCFTMTHSGGTVKLNNCYYLYTVGTVQGTPYEEEELASGALCYKLNGDQSRIRWKQTIGSDEEPFPYGNHLRVYGAGDIYMNIKDNASYNTFVSLIISSETERYGDMKVQKSLVDSYLNALNSLRQAPDIDSFLDGYEELGGMRQSIKSCAEAYSKYIAKVEETIAYLEEHTELANEKVEMLKIYLTEYDEPNEDYPHGSAPAILEECTLSEQEIIAETTLIDEKLKEAITYAPTAGVDMSMLFTNIDLSDRFNGWEGKLPTGWGTSETSPLYAAECLAATMDMHQTITGIQNGIYELRVNGAFRPTPYDDYFNTNYAATLYANGIHNYFQTNIEDMISVDDAVDGVNCNINGPVADFAIKDIDGNVEGYTMQGIVSCCNAFQAGRYPNSVLCNVTDGTLTIGIRQPGTGLSRDWLGFGNIKVIYWGEMNEAAEGLDNVLASQSARAQALLEYEYSSGTDYATYPNFSQALKDELQQTLNAAETAADPAAKYQIIEKFSSLFLQIYDCKQAYITLMDKAEEVNSMLSTFSSILSDDDFLQMEDLYNTLTIAYEDGTMTAEEARAIDLKQLINFYPDMEDGYYLLRNENDYFVFASMVNGGATKNNAKLLADIDLRNSSDPNLMIGNTDARYAGIFDGQGHTITYSYDCTANYCGLFSYISGATIRNLRVEGEVVTRGIHYGALIGYGDGTMLIENVVTNVNITGEHSGVTGNGGMIGALYGKITFNNCATQGIMGYPGSSMYCGFVAFASGDGYSTLNNCYTSCVLTEGTGTDYCYTFCRGSFTANNCYYLNTIGVAQGTKMTAEQFESGEVCYKLNGSQTAINWYQTLGEDAFPTLDETHKRVYKTDDGSYTNEKVDTPDGSKENPFVVKSAADLADLPNKFAPGQMTYVVMENDIDMAGVTDWKPLFNYPAATDEYPYPFIDFDGKGHVIRNLTSNLPGSYDYPGIFGVLCGNVRNLGVENADVTSTGGTGILAGYLGHSKYGQPCYVENVWVTGKVSAAGYCGGMFGNIGGESHILNCYANVEVNGSGDLTGGIIGRVRGLVDMVQVYAAGSINRGGGIIGGGQQDATPLGSYKHVAVWNNTENNFGPTRANEDLRQIIYYDGTNFADLQSQVVAWDNQVWFCDMAEGSYPVLKAFTTGLEMVQGFKSSKAQDIYDLSGHRVEKATKGLYIVSGKKLLVK
ncbi:MAG: hypothetical protein K5945_06030 [Bacteroidaceae bacterium]|nr:hypothetical protein [Bacteroidaceae bacterium]